MQKSSEDENYDTIQIMYLTILHIVVELDQLIPQLNLTKLRGPYE